MQTQAPSFHSGQSVRYVSDYLREVAGKVGTIIQTGRFAPSDTEHTVAEVDFGRGRVLRCSLSNLRAA